MIKYLSGRLAEGATVVVADALSARQLEACLAPSHPDGHQVAWESPRILTHQAWMSGLWATPADPARPPLLTSQQCHALWRRVVRDSPEAQSLTGIDNAARWAADAWTLLHAWDLQTSDYLSAAWDSDFEVFLRWQGKFREALAAYQCLDPVQLPQSLCRQPPPAVTEQVIWADFLELTPELANLLDTLAGAQWTIGRWSPAHTPARAERVCLPDAAAELECAARWAAAKLQTSPAARLAIVVPDLEQRRAQIHRALADTLTPEAVVIGSPTPSAYSTPGGEPIDDQPVLGAALNALELFSEQGTFSALSRWLRSPYFRDEPACVSTRARLETRLRRELFAQLGFVEALRRGGAAGFLRHHAPDIAADASAALALLNASPRQCTPSRWTQIWQSLLRRLGWPGALETESAAASVKLWESVLNDFAQLTLVLGRISMTEALAELGLVLKRKRLSGPMPVRGVSVLPTLDAVGPGYDAVWASGMTDAYWPRPARPNPLLPLSLQAEHGMPFATPQDALDRCRRRTQRLLTRTPEVVFSWPGTVHEYPAEPSPLIVRHPQTPPEALVDEQTRRLARGLIGAVARESIDDRPPPVTDANIAGGAGTLNAQSLCPLRAFCQYRLGARALEPVSRGLSPRLRGIITHRAVELSWRGFEDQAALARMEPSERRAWLEKHAEDALKETFRSSSRPLRVLFDLEKMRLVSLLNELVDRDLRRQAFRIERLEERQTSFLRGLSLGSRIDRVDRLEDGSLAIIDYKTGAQARVTDWLKARLVDTQIPLYTLVVGEPVSAAVIGLIRSQGVRYNGFWEPAERFPGRRTPLPAGRTWAEQLETWRAQILSLVEEFANGDVRLLETGTDQAEGAFAPLSRVYEQRALAFGWIEGWGNR